MYPKFLFDIHNSFYRLSKMSTHYESWWEIFIGIKIGTKRWLCQACGPFWQPTLACQYGLSGSTHTSRWGTGGVPIHAYCLRLNPLSMPKAKPLIMSLGLQFLHLRRKPIILHKLASFFVSSSHSFLYYSESNVKAAQKTKLPSIEIINCLLSIANIKRQQFEPLHVANGRRVTLKFNSASSSGLNSLGLHNRDEGEALRWQDIAQAIFDVLCPRRLLRAIPKTYIYVLQCTRSEYKPFNEVFNIRLYNMAAPARRRTREKRM